MTTHSRGFTLIEMMVVMVVVALLLTIATPRYIHSLDRARETVLRENLTLIRDALDKYFSDHGRYPDGLPELVSRRYLRALPVDPLTDSSETWLTVAPGRPVASAISGADTSRPRWPARQPSTTTP